MNHSPSRRRSLVLLTGLFVHMSVRAQPEDPWTPIRPLLGEWTGTSSGKPGEATVTRTYASVLGGRYIQEVSLSVYLPQQKNPKGERHEHIGYFSFDRARKVIVLRQFHIEGFVNTYRLAQASSNPKSLIFESEAFENLAASWKARESYTFDGADEFTEVFELAPPNKDFEVYTRTQFKRVQK